MSDDERVNGVVDNESLNKSLKFLKDPRVDLIGDYIWRERRGDYAPLTRRGMFDENERWYERYSKSSTTG